MGTSTLGSEIRRLCHLAGFAPEGLATETGLDPATVRRTIEANTHPRSSTLKRIEDVFVARRLIEPGYLLTLQEPSATHIAGSNAVLATRSEVDLVLGSVEARWAAAKKEILISGNDCKYVVESLSGEMEEALMRKVKIRVLVVDPTGLGAKIVPYLDPRFPTDESFIKSMASVSPVLERLRATWQARFDYRYLPFVPPVGLFIVDKDEDDGFVKAEIYCVKPYLPLRSRPHLLLSESGPHWREYFIQQWHNQWKLGSRSQADTA